jgi:hypothetical protein
VNREELTERDAHLLEETRQVVLSAPADIPRNPVWGQDYDPLAILSNPRSYPEHTEIALVNVRIAMHPEEHWSKCADCGRVFLADDETPGETVCSPECWNFYARYMAAEVGCPLSTFTMLDESPSEPAPSYGGDRPEEGRYGRDL